jgi:type I restriction enzyme S subunit
MGNSSAKSFYNTALPMDWEVLEFGKFAEKEKEKYLPSENENLRCIELEHFEQGTGHISGWINSSEQKSTKNRFTKGQVLFGKLRPYLQKYWLAEYEGVCSSEVWVLNSKNKKCCNEYLYRLVQTNHFIQVANVSSGSKMPRADWDYVASFPFPLPPLPEQKAIANILSMMDAAINKNNQLIIQKELQKKWLMQNLLTGKKRLKGFEEEWKEYHLGEMFFERNETRFIDLQLLSVGANGIYPQADSIKKDTSNEDKSKYKRICPGDIGYNTMRMWQGRSALSGLEGIVSPAYTIVIPKNNSNSIFFSYLFKTSKLMNLFWRNSQGLVDDTLNCKFKDFSIVKVCLPSKGEQTAIARVLLTIDKELELQKATTVILREQKKWLMQVLLTGRKRLILKQP